MAISHTDALIAYNTFRATIGRAALTSHNITSERIDDCIVTIRNDFDWVDVIRWDNDTVFHMQYWDNAERRHTDVTVDGSTVTATDGGPA